MSKNKPYYMLFYCLIYCMHMKKSSFVISDSNFTRHTAEYRKFVNIFGKITVTPQCGGQHHLLSLPLYKDVLLQGRLYQSTFRFKAVLSTVPARIVQWSQLKHGSFSGSPKYSFFYLTLDWWLSVYTGSFLFPPCKSLKCT